MRRSARLRSAQPKRNAAKTTALRVRARARFSVLSLWRGKRVVKHRELALSPHERLLDVRWNHREVAAVKERRQMQGQELRGTTSGALRRPSRRERFKKTFLAEARASGMPSRRNAGETPRRLRSARGASLRKCARLARRRALRATHRSAGGTAPRASRRAPRGGAPRRGEVLETLRTGTVPLPPRGSDSRGPQARKSRPRKSRSQPHPRRPQLRRRRLSDVSHP